ncbi:type VII secretion-associated protein [Mycobacterium sp. pUA109]|uniref:type VII secretion-associated protein n=1 Tax=Mycobacterium sp. pUA109 TaxID=3238982 RepID=UPI00351B6CC1
MDPAAVTARPAVIEAGPGAIRRLGRGAADPPGVDAETAAAALDALDDPVALVHAQPVGVDALWRTMLRNLCGTAPAVLIVHPSWWAAARVRRVRTAALAFTADVTTRCRARVLAAAAPGPAVVVEIAPQLVAITATTVAAVPRTGPPDRVAAAVAGRLTAMTSEAPATVLIDAPATVGGAPALAAMIATRLRATAAAVDVLDDTALATAITDTQPQPGPPPPARRPRRAALPGAAVVLAAALCGVATCGRHHTPVAAVSPPTFLVEGQITLQVPAQWPMQRVTAGPGSARVVLSAPGNPQLALHVTQSPLADPALSATAASLQRALADQPPGVFVDFDPAGRYADRPAVTYREVRPGHDIGWVILVDDTVRISIGCQSPPGDEDAVRDVCERAVRSAHRWG